MTDYVQEQDMEIEALEAILMDDFKEIHSSESGLNASNRCFQITLSSQDDGADESNPSVQLALIFSHTERYPDEPPLLSVRSLKGIQEGDLAALKEKLEQEATDNLGMAMIYTLVTSAKEWLSESFSQDAGTENTEEDEVAKDGKGAVSVDDESEDDEENIDFDDDDFEDDEEDMLEHYLAERSDTSSHSSRRASVIM